MIDADANTCERCGAKLGSRYWADHPDLGDHCQECHTMFVTDEDSPGRLVVRPVSDEEAAASQAGTSHVPQYILDEIEEYNREQEQLEQHQDVILPDDEWDAEIDEELRDMKEALGRVSKPDVTHIRRELKVYGGRACEYGSDKYERSNYLRRLKTPAEDFNRLRTYLRACMDHVDKTLGAMEEHQANDPDLENFAGMSAAASCPDTEAGQHFPASNLPHLAHAVASLNMAIKQAVDAGLLPDDPGTPWKKKDCGE